MWGTDLMLYCAYIVNAFHELSRHRTDVAMHLPEALSSSVAQ
ncbi:hypothetical protein PC114_g11923 [Phytophthora cactorum]|nr:hypothetical protein PC114_g11923 [Phytophthora cactorum]